MHKLILLLLACGLSRVAVAQSPVFDTYAHSRCGLSASNRMQVMNKQAESASEDDVVFSHGRLRITGKSVPVGNDTGAYRLSYFSGKQVIGLFDDQEDFSEIGRAFFVHTHNADYFLIEFAEEYGMHYKLFEIRQGNLRVRARGIVLFKSDEDRAEDLRYAIGAKGSNLYLDAERGGGHECHSLE